MVERGTALVPKDKQFSIHFVTELRTISGYYHLTVTNLTTFYRYEFSVAAMINKIVGKYSKTCHAVPKPGGEYNKDTQVLDSCTHHQEGEMHATVNSTTFIELCGLSVSDKL